MTDTEKRARPRRTDVVWLHPYADVTIIGIDTPHDSLDKHPLWDHRIHDALKAEDIASIRNDGVLEPCTVNKDGDKYRVVDGRGRMRRARVVCDEQIAAGVPFTDPDGGLTQIRVPCMVVRGTDEQLMMLSRKLNSGRTPETLQRMGAFAEIMQRKYGKSMEEIAAVYSVSVSTVRNALATLNLSDEGNAALESGLVSPTGAVLIAQLSRDDQAVLTAEIKREAAEGILPTVERINIKVREKQGKAATKTPRTRVAKATEILTEFADSHTKLPESASRAELATALTAALALLDKVSRALTDKSVAKLAATGD